MFFDSGGVIRKKASLVICVIDDFTDRMVSGANIIVRADSFNAFRRDDGYYVFINLPVKEYTAAIESDIYFRETFKINVEDIGRPDPVVFVRLKPNTLYPVPSSGATCIRGSLYDNNGHVSGALISIENASPVQAIKVAEDNQEASKKALKLYTAGEVRLEGKEFLINDSDASCREHCRIAGFDGEVFLLADKLQHNHKRGTALLPVERSYTDMRGNFIILLKLSGNEKIDVKLIFEYNGKRESRKLALANGEMLNAGRVYLEE